MSKYVVSLQGDGFLPNFEGDRPEERCGFYTTWTMWAKTSSEAESKALRLVHKELDDMNLASVSQPRRVWVNDVCRAKILLWRFWLWGPGRGFTWYPEDS